MYSPGDRADGIADWIEVECLLRATPLSAQSLIERAREHGLGEVDVSLGLRTMQRRTNSVGGSYPFRVANGASAVNTADSSAWVAMLLMSPHSPARPLLAIKEAAELFELITRDAGNNLLGEGTKSIRFGWPSQDGRPREFPDAVRWLAERMGIACGGAYRPPRNKDGGVDVVIWRPFPDGRSGFPAILVQCTLERDFFHKAADVDIRVWSSWLELDVDPMTALAIPCVVPAGESWNLLASRTVVLDRIRLASLSDLRHTGSEVLKDWTNSALDLIRETR